MQDIEHPENLKDILRVKQEELAKIGLLLLKESKRTSHNWTDYTLHIERDLAFKGRSNPYIPKMQNTLKTKEIGKWTRECTNCGLKQSTDKEPLQVKAHRLQIEINKIELQLK